jgi:hypothetical protein
MRPKGRTLSDNAFDGQAATMAVQDVFDQGEAKPGA